MKLQFFLLLLQVDIKKKISEAPDSSYEIGVAIASYLPFVLLVIVAYIIYNKAKNRADLDE